MALWLKHPVFYSKNESSECSGPKGCPRKKLEHDFWGRGQNPKVQIAKKNLKDILNNVKSNYKAQATITFSISKKIWFFFKILIFLGHPLKKMFFTLQPRIYLLFGLLGDLTPKMPSWGI